MRYTVIVECNLREYRYHRKFFRKYPFSYNEDSECARADVKKSQYAYIKDYCRRNRLKYRIGGDYGKRGTDYRRKYFEKNKPVFGKYYLCTYCGRPVKRSKVTIDHIYPVNEVAHNLKLQKKLTRIGYQDVNDVRNLVPACETCNKRKSAKMGSWIAKAKLFHNQYMRLFGDVVEVGILVFAVIYIIF